jgi:5-methylcytosine-specific restriction endonuclease McrA
MLSSSTSANREIVILWPDEVPNMVRVYDSANRQVALWLGGEGSTLRWSLECRICAERFTNVEEDNLIPVVENPFSHYYDLEEEGLDRLARGALRRDIIKFYGKKCFQCKRFLSGKDITIDHIVAYNGGEGATIPTNLQVLCRKCNEEKANLPAETVRFALDFPIRPASSESYEGIAW